MTQIVDTSRFGFKGALEGKRGRGDGDERIVLLGFSDLWPVYMAKKNYPTCYIRYTDTFKVLNVVE